VAKAIGARLNVERADVHARDAERAVREFFASTPYAISTRRDPQTSRLIYFIETATEAPPEIALSVGDAVHRLRTALDHLAYELVTKGTGRIGPFKHATFPIFDSKTLFDQGMSQPTKGMKPAAAAAIDGIAPYKGGNDALWQLHRLDIIDKHRLLLTVGSAYRSVDIGPVIGRRFGSFPDGTPIPAFSLFLRPADTLFPLKVGDELYIDEPNAEPDPSIQFRLDIVVNEAGVVEGESLAEMLARLRSTVQDVISALEPFL
jgi:hypothetical protein